LRSLPIFDTNIFSHVQSGKIPHSDWRFLISRRPAGSWPLSSVTALELLAALDDVSPERFAEFRDRIKLAFRLSNGFVHEEPRYLICRDVLNVPFRMATLLRAGRTPRSA
jgi:predicted nucleic acid-binding protein